jgi:hypothetical protein
MPTHKFQIGQTVFLSPSLGLNVPGGAYIIQKHLPDDNQAELVNMWAELGKRSLVAS